jgi:hypothetical protein
MKKIFLVVIGFLLIIYSVLVWIAYLSGAITIFNNGPTSIFLTAKISHFGNLINFLIFILGASALVTAAFFMKSKKEGTGGNP